MWNTIYDEDPGAQILSAYIAKEELRTVRCGGDPHRARRRLHRFLSWHIDSMIPELVTLARTVDAWWPAINAFVLTGITNARTEGYNRLAKTVKRAACGFRNRENSASRIRFHCTRTQRVAANQTSCLFARTKLRSRCVCGWTCRGQGFMTGGAGSNRRPRRREQFRTLIAAEFADSDETSGYRRVHAALGRGTGDLATWSAAPAAPVRYCGRDFTATALDTIRALVTTVPTRARIAEATCAALGWRRVNGAAKAMSARLALNKMAADGLIVLPAPRNSNGNGRNVRHTLAHPTPLAPSPVHTDLAGLGTLRAEPVTTRTHSRLDNTLIATHHYLGYTPLAGAQLRYLVHAETTGVVAALGFGAAAWTCASRDTHIGWDTPTRQARLPLIIRNARFQICPHIQVTNLASHLLARILARLPADWNTAYGYTPVLVETFIETGRFTGASYRAANWTRVGHTTGRGKLDRTHCRSKTSTSTPSTATTGPSSPHPTDHSHRIPRRTLASARYGPTEY